MARQDCRCSRIIMQTQGMHDVAIPLLFEMPTPPSEFSVWRLTAESGKVALKWNRLVSHSCVDAAHGNAELTSVACLATFSLTESAPLISKPQCILLLAFSHEGAMQTHDVFS